jgi:hypothetical protein
MAMEFLPGILLHDSEIVVAGGSYLSWAMPGVMKKLGQDREFVLACVGRDGLSLKYAAMAYKGDFEVVATAVQQNARSIRFAQQALQDDPDIMEHVVRTSPKLIRCSRKLAMDKAFILRAVRANPRVIHYMSPELLTEEQFLIQVVAEEPVTLCSTRFGNSKDFVLEAVRRNPAVLEYAGLSLQNDKDILLAVEIQCEDEDKGRSICSTDVDSISSLSAESHYSSEVVSRSPPKSVKFDLCEPETKKFTVRSSSYHNSL